MNGRTRVAVTRDEPVDGRLARALRREGLEPVACPVVVTLPAPAPAPLADAALGLESFDWIVVASVRALEALLELRAERALPSSIRAAAVGSRTADALRLAGARDVLVATLPGAGALARELAGAERWPGRRVLVPRAEEGGRELASTLRALGAEVVEVVAYRTVPRTAREIAGDWSVARPDAVVIASPSAAHALVAALGNEALRSLAAVVAIGPSTASALAALGVESTTSDDADFPALASTTRRALACARKEG